MKRELIREIRYYVPNLSADEQLAIQTCPGYNKALDRAIADTYREKPCRDCHRLTVSVEGAIARVDIRGKCPKM